MAWTGAEQGCLQTPLPGAPLILTSNSGLAPHASASIAAPFSSCLLAPTLIRGPPWGTAKPLLMFTLPSGPALPPHLHPSSGSSLLVPLDCSMLPSQGAIGTLRTTCSSLGQCPTVPGLPWAPPLLFTRHQPCFQQVALADADPHPQPSLDWSLRLGPLASVLAENRGGVNLVEGGLDLPGPTPHICSSWEMVSVTIKVTSDFRLCPRFASAASLSLVGGSLAVGTPKCFPSSVAPGSWSCPRVEGLGLQTGSSSVVD